MGKPAKAAKKSTTAKHKIAKGGGSGALMIILNTVAALKVSMNKESVDRDKLSFYAGTKFGKSTIANALTQLKKSEWMIVTPQTVSITAAGMENADQEALERAAANVPKTNKDFWATVQEQHKLPPKQVQLFEALQDGRTHLKTEVLVAVFGKMNSTSSNAMTAMKKCEIIEFDKTTIRLKDEMFPVEPRPVE